MYFDPEQQELIFEDLKHSRFESFDSLKLMLEEEFASFFDICHGKRAFDAMVALVATDRYVCSRITTQSPLTAKMLSLISLVFLASFKTEKEEPCKQSLEILKEAFRQNLSSTMRYFSSQEDFWLFKWMIVAEDGHLFARMYRACNFFEEFLFLSTRMYTQMTVLMANKIIDTYKSSWDVLIRSPEFQELLATYIQYPHKEMSLTHYLETRTYELELSCARSVIVDLVLNPKVPNDIVEYVLRSYLS